MGFTGYAHQNAKTCYTEGKWSLMYGPLSWLQDTPHYFMHHDCGPNKNDRPLWMNWYTSEKEDDDNWCTYCDSEPPTGIVGMFNALEFL
jgi:hypothetical protein